VASSASQPSISSNLPGGVPPLRAGEGYSFLLRRLHSLSGIFPIGAYVLEHMISNAFANRGANAYSQQVHFLTGLPFVLALEIFFIFIPLAYHAGYGLVIWWGGKQNAGSAYPWAGNWLYGIQRWTGILALAYIGYHTWSMRFSGVHILSNPDAAFAKVWLTLQNPWIVAFYFLGVFAATWHFAYGIWLFAAKWGITTGESARRHFGYVCIALGIAMALVWSSTMISFVSTPRTNPQLIRSMEFLRQAE
jgi:succinate dehydrogenase / fumarate reductase cytochrome b subunit